VHHLSRSLSLGPRQGRPELLSGTRDPKISRAANRIVAPLKARPRPADTRL